MRAPNRMKKRMQNINRMQKELDKEWENIIAKDGDGNIIDVKKLTPDQRADLILEVELGNQFDENKGDETPDKVIKKLCRDIDKEYTDIEMKIVLKYRTICDVHRVWNNVFLNKHFKITDEIVERNTMDTEEILSHFKEERKYNVKFGKALTLKELLERNEKKSGMVELIDEYDGIITRK
jgi:hypothetical protein